MIEGDLVAGRYRLAARLGSGAFGDVWRARDERYQRNVALKFMRPELSRDATLRRRFEREIRALAGLEHPNVLQVFDDGEWRGVPFYVMEFVSGGSLREWLGDFGKHRRPVPLDEVRTVFMQLCKGMGAAHRAGVVHRDLKPENVLLGRDDEGAIVARIADFGLARLPGQSATVSAIVGTVAYMSPEQAVMGSEGVGPASDVFALGVILVELLTGRYVPDEEAPAAWERQASMGRTGELIAHLAPLRPDAPRAVWDVAYAALAASPRARIADAQELGRRFAAAWSAPPGAHPHAAASVHSVRPDAPPPSRPAAAPAPAARQPSVIPFIPSMDGRGANPPPAAPQPFIPVAPAPPVVNPQPPFPGVLPASGFGLGSPQPTWELPSIRRLADTLVLRDRATLPPQCVTCGALDRVEYKPWTLIQAQTGLPVVAAVLSCIGAANVAVGIGLSVVLAFLLVASRNTVEIDLPVCGRHTAARLGWRAATSVAAVVGGGLLVAAIGFAMDPEHAWYGGRVFCVPGLLLVWSASIFYRAKCLPVTLVTQNHRETRIGQVAEPVMQHFPETSA